MESSQPQLSSEQPEQPLQPDIPDLDTVDRGHIIPGTITSVEGSGASVDLGSEHPEQPPQPDIPDPDTVDRGDIIPGTITSVEESGALVDLGIEKKGIVPPHDLERLSADRRDALRVGDELPVYITGSEDSDGRLVVSIHQAILNEKWLDAERLKESGEIWEGKVAGYNQGGVIVPLGKLRGFVPISQLLDIPRRSNPSQIRERLGNYVGRTLPLRVIEVDRRKRRLVLSYRKAFSEWRERERREFIESLSEGEVRTGRVRELQDFGAFVDLGGGDGLIHISELAWHRVKHPKEVLRVGDRIKVYLLKVNRKRKRVALSLKRLTPHPWSTIEERYHVNQLVEGEVTRVASFGAFVRLEPGIEGLLHVQHLPRTAGKDPGKVVFEGEVHLLRIISIDAERRRIRLSLRAVTTEEQMEWMARHAPRVAATPVDDAIGLSDLIGEEE